MSTAQNAKNYYTIEDFNNLPEDFHTELINGALYRKAMPNRIHQELVGRLSTAICNYIQNKRNDCSVYMSLGAQLFKDQNIVLIPDLSVICDRCKLNERGCMGAPDWIIEIMSPSDAAHDYIDKLFFYYNAGVIMLVCANTGLSIRRALLSLSIYWSRSISMSGHILLAILSRLVFLKICSLTLQILV